SRIDLPTLLLGTAERAFRPTFWPGPLDLPPDPRDVRRLHFGEQPPRRRRPCAGRTLFHPHPLGRPQVMLVHATSLALKGGGRWRAVLLRGPSGAGKSDLALRLIDRGARLIADDQTHLARKGRALVATAPPAIAGMIEVRGIGIVKLGRHQL